MVKNNNNNNNKLPKWFREAWKILSISDDEMDFTVGFFSQNLVTQKILVEFRDIRIFHDFQGNGHLVTPRDEILMRILGVRK